MTYELTGDGYRGVKLGMNEAGVRATGRLGTLSWDTPWCNYYSTADRPADNRTVIISDKFGVVDLRAPDTARTPEGVGAGSTVAELKAKYPGAEEYRNGFTVDVPGYADRFYDFWIDADTMPYPDTAKVVQIGLNSVHYDC